MIKNFNGKMPKIAESAFISETTYIVGYAELARQYRDQGL